MTAYRRLPLLLLLALLVACAKPAEPEAAVATAPGAPAATTLEPPPRAGSCQTEAIGVCQDFHGAGHTANEVQSTCTGQRLKYTREGCPLADRIGTCLLFADQPVASRLRYYGRFAPGVDGAQEQCVGKLQGQWFPG